MTLLLNLLLPGAGLIMRRREWLGFCLVLLFGVCANVVLAGWLIAPESIPLWLQRLALGMTVVTWGLSQWLYAHQGRVLRRRSAAIQNLARDARRALDSGDRAAADHAIESMRAIDDESPELDALVAEMKLDLLHKSDSKPVVRSDVGTAV